MSCTPLPKSHDTLTLSTPNLSTLSKARLILTMLAELAKLTGRVLSYSPYFPPKSRSFIGADRIPECVLRGHKCPNIHHCDPPCDPAQSLGIMQDCSIDTLLFHRVTACAKPRVLATECSVVSAPQHLSTIAKCCQLAGWRAAGHAKNQFAGHLGYPVLSTS